MWWRSLRETCKTALLSHLLESISKNCPYMHQFHATAKISVIWGPYQGQKPSRCLTPHVTPLSFFVPVCMLATQCWPYLAEYLREGATALLSSCATMGSFLVLLRPPSLCSPLRACRQAFLSTHSIRPLSFAVIHYSSRRSMSCAAVRRRTNANISVTDVILYMKKYDHAIAMHTSWIRVF